MRDTWKRRKTSLRVAVDSILRVVQEHESPIGGTRDSPSEFRARYYAGMKLAVDAFGRAHDALTNIEHYKKNHHETYNSLPYYRDHLVYIATNIESLRRVYDALQDVNDKHRSISEVTSLCVSIGPRMVPFFQSS